MSASVCSSNWRIDEIDIYQSDSIFRPALEKVIDYYFKFEKYLRCLVSATVREFSNPRINCEPTIDITYPEPAPRTINLIHTNNPHAIIKEKIEELFAGSPDEKIVIAYNKIKFIRYIIQNLSEACKAECAILCSGASKDHAGRFYREFTNDELPARITFMTNPFFAGLDFAERFHLISVSNVDMLYTLLSPDRFQQIAGRCRHREGLYSEMIVYNTKTYDGELQPDTRREQLLECANDLSEYVNRADTLSEKYPELADSLFKRVKEDIYKKSERYYYTDTKMAIVRKNAITDEYLPAYFNIDSLYDTLKLHIDLYTEPEKLCRALIEAGHHATSMFNQNRAYTDTQRSNDQIVDQEFDQAKQDGIDAVIEQIRDKAGSLPLTGLMGAAFAKFLEGLHRNSSRDVQKYVLCVRELYRFVSLDELLPNLKEKYNNKKAYRGYYNAAVFWALEDNHLFKNIIMRDFPEGAVLSTSQIKEYQGLTKMETEKSLSLRH